MRTGGEVEDGEEVLLAFDGEEGSVEGGAEVGVVAVGKAEASAGFVDGEIEGEGA